MAERTFTERIEVAGKDLVDRIKELATDADAKRVVIRDQEEKELLSVPLTWGFAGGAVAVVAAPVLAAVAAIGGLAARFSLDVVRTEDPADDDVPTGDTPAQIEAPTDDPV